MAKNERMLGRVDFQQLEDDLNINTRDKPDKNGNIWYCWATRKIIGPTRGFRTINLWIEMAMVMMNEAQREKNGRTQ